MTELERDIQIAENRIKAMEERRSYFAKKFEETGNVFYKKMAESETDSIAEVREAIIEACLK